MKYLLIFILFFSVLSHAVEVTTADGFRIRADTVVADLKEGVVTHSGNVIVSQENMIFKADRIEVHRKGGVLTKLMANGHPTVFIEKLASNVGIHQGEASALIYTASDSKITIKEYKLKDSVGNSHSGRVGVYLLGKYNK